MKWQYQSRVEKELERNMKALFQQIVVAIGKETDPATIGRKLKIISNQPQFHQTAMSMALTMTAKVNAATAKSWREAARMAGRGNDIYTSIFASLQDIPGFFEAVRANADYIRSVPTDIADWITDKVQAESLKGRRASDIAVDILEKYPSMLESRAQLIARTEVSKTQLALTQARCANLGIDWYVWRTSRDSRVRSPHDDMEGVLVAWSDAPSPEKLFPHPDAKPYGNYHAGGTFNCRCYPEPVVAVELVLFPCKVYHNGGIRQMTKEQFLKIA